ncbi:MAG: phosphatidate cytidylyltransferase [FCB group bacterium]|nr:phosphatidate cytidylyltransferase [FCB group bacterium]
MISKNLTQRISVAVVAIPAILFLIFRGGDLFLYFILLLAAVGIYEYLHGGKLALTSPFFLIPFAGVLGAVYFTATGSAVYGGICLLGVFILTGILLAIGTEPIDALFNRMVYIIWGSFYIGLLFPFVYLVRGEGQWLSAAAGSWWVFYLLGSLWLCDTAALFFGRQFGRHKLAPTVSPNKTVEGFVGGFVGVFLAAALFKTFWLQDVAYWHFIAIGTLIGLFGQLGDLVESLWKRSQGIKDSSAIIPGHGGVLDRFDSLLFAAPVMYLYLKYVLQASWLQSYSI